MSKNVGSEFHTIWENIAEFIQTKHTLLNINLKLFNYRPSRDYNQEKETRKELLLSTVTVGLKLVIATTFTKFQF